MAERGERAPDARFTLANERTLLAYQRSAIGLMAAAIAVAHFFGDGLRCWCWRSRCWDRGVRGGGRVPPLPPGRRALRRGRTISSGSAAHMVSLAVLLCLCFAAFYVITQAG